MKATHQITVHNELRIYVEADHGTHANTMASFALKHLETLPAPEYVEWNGTKRPGQWCRALGPSADYYRPGVQTSSRKLYWRTIVVPA